MRLKFVTLIVGLGIASCAPTWDKAGGSQEQFDGDNTRCQFQARVMAPGVSNGTTGFIVAATVGAVAANTAAQQNIYRQCMMARGYTAR